MNGSETILGSCLKFFVLANNLGYCFCARVWDVVFQQRAIPESQYLKAPHRVANDLPISLPHHDFVPLKRIPLSYACNTTIDDEHHKNLSANGYRRTLPNSARRWHSDSPEPLDVRQARSIVPESIVEHYEYPYAEQIEDEDTYERGGKVLSYIRKRLHHNPRYSAAWKEKGKDKVTQRNEEVINPVTPSAARFNSSNSSSPIDDSDSDDATQWISKPKGYAGRPNSGGYSLEQELRWKEKEYKRFKAKVKSLVSEALYTSKPYSSQADGLIQYVCESVAHEFPKSFGLYEENWPVKDLIRLELRYAQTS